MAYLFPLRLHRRKTERIPGSSALSGLPAGTDRGLRCLMAADQMTNCSR